MLEMTVALTVAVVVIAALGGFALRQQRFHRDIVVAAERLEQLEQAAILLPLALRGIAPGEGDIPPGGATDTSIEFRSVVATGVACAAPAGRILVAPQHGELPVLSSVLTRPVTGDTAWLLSPVRAGGEWRPQVIAAVRDSTVRCQIGNRHVWADAAPGLLLRVADTVLVPSGAVVRVTRTWRYSLYRASDGGWFLGARDWNPATQRLNTIQPVGGPFLSAGNRGLRFTYTDAEGNAVASGTGETGRIAAIGIAFRSDTGLPGRYPHALALTGRAETAVNLRNRRR